MGEPPGRPIKQKIAARSAVAMLHHAAVVNVAATYPPRLNKRLSRSSIPPAMEPYARPSALAGVKFRGIGEVPQGLHQVCRDEASVLPPQSSPNGPV